MMTKDVDKPATEVVPECDGQYHLCIEDLCIHEGPVEECCLKEWHAEGAAS